MNPMMKALLCRDRGGFRIAWLMGRASFWHSRGYGLTLWEAFAGAWLCFWDYLRKK